MSTQVVYASDFSSDEELQAFIATMPRQLDEIELPGIDKVPPVVLIDDCTMAEDALRHGLDPVYIMEKHGAYLRQTAGMKNHRTPYAQALLFAINRKLDVMVDAILVELHKSEAGEEGAKKPVELYRDHAEWLRRVIALKDKHEFAASNLIKEITLSLTTPWGELENPGWLDSMTGEELAEPLEWIEPVFGEPFLDGVRPEKSPWIEKVKQWALDLFTNVDERWDFFNANVPYEGDPEEEEDDIPFDELGEAEEEEMPLYMTSDLTNTADAYAAREQIREIFDPYYAYMRPRLKQIEALERKLEQTKAGIEDGTVQPYKGILRQYTDPIRTLWDEIKDRKAETHQKALSLMEEISGDLEPQDLFLVLADLERRGVSNTDPEDDDENALDFEQFRKVAIVNGDAMPFNEFAEIQGEFIMDREIDGRDSNPFVDERSVPEIDVSEMLIHFPETTEEVLESPGWKALPNAVRHGDNHLVKRKNPITHTRLWNLGYILAMQAGATTSEAHNKAYDFWRTSISKEGQEAFIFVLNYVGEHEVEEVEHLDGEMITRPVKDEDGKLVPNPAAYRMAWQSFYRTANAMNHIHKIPVSLNSRGITIRKLTGGDERFIKYGLAARLVMNGEIRFTNQPTQTLKDEEIAKLESADRQRMLDLLQEKGWGRPLATVLSRS